ncbi:conserved hypothetical protein [mine drainage metagenome]|uniref:Uncharacterized protein n=1 Tax=mine drainage metagenome TaxID=410659 RepID=A0A3P3ZMD5_9ZZZZ
MVPPNQHHTGVMSLLRNHHNHQTGHSVLMLKPLEAAKAKARMLEGNNQYRSPSHNYDEATRTDESIASKAGVGIAGHREVDYVSLSTHFNVPNSGYCSNRWRQRRRRNGS